MRRHLLTSTVLASLVLLAAVARAQAPAPAPAADPKADIALPTASGAPASAPAVSATVDPAQPGPAEPVRPRLADPERNKTPGVVGAKAKSKNPFDWWVNYTDQLIDRVDKMDLYGVTSQLPRGVFKVKWDWVNLKASNRYNDKRQLGPVMAPIEMLKDSANPSKGKVLSLDMGLRGSGGGNTIQMSYGILGNLDWYIELPFQYMDLSFNPVANPVDAEGNKIDAQYASMLGISDPKSLTGKQLLAKLLPRLGRPVPGLRYKGKWALGDINTGFSWNFFRTHRMSAAFTGRVFLPTGRIADPNDSLLYGTGPELDVGRGGWAVGFTQGYDLRIYKYSFWIDIVASTEFTAAYSFTQNRKYPTNFTKPDPIAAVIDPVSFPDLSHLGKCGNPSTFQYKPGWSLGWTAQLQFSIAMLGLGVGYGVDFSQMPEVRADQKFINMVKGLDLLGASATHAIQLSASVNLLPLYVPVEVAFQWRKAVDGYNAIVFKDYYNVIVNLYVPIYPMKPILFPSDAWPEYNKLTAKQQGWEK